MLCDSCQHFRQADTICLCKKKVFGIELRRFLNINKCTKYKIEEDIADNFKERQGCNN